MMQSANNGHHGTHPSASSHHYPPHLDPRYMDYANMAHHHSSVVDPHLHYLPPSALPQSHLGSGLKRNADSAGLDMMSGTPSSTGGISSDEDSDVKPPLGERTAGTGRGKSTGPDPATGKKTKGRVKIKMEFIDNKLRRYTTFSKRKTGIMKKGGQEEDQSDEGDEESEDGEREFSAALNEEEEIAPPTIVPKPPRNHPKLAFKAQALASNKGKGLGKRSIDQLPPPQQSTHHGIHPIGFVQTNPTTCTTITPVNVQQPTNLIMIPCATTTTTTSSNMAYQSTSRVNNLPPEVKLQLMNTGHMVTPEGTLVRIPVPLTTHGQISMGVPQHRPTNVLTMTTAIPRFPPKNPP